MLKSTWNAPFGSGMMRTSPSSSRASAGMAAVLLAGGTRSGMAAGVFAARMRGNWTLMIVKSSTTSSA